MEVQYVYKYVQICTQYIANTRSYIGFYGNNIANGNSTKKFVFLPFQLSCKGRQLRLSGSLIMPFILLLLGHLVLYEK